MKRMFIIIIILTMILVGMIIYKKTAVGSTNKVNIQEIEKIEEYIAKIYGWKEITKEALPTFQSINDANELWSWEIVKKNLEEYTISYEKIQSKAKELFGEEFTKQFPKEGNEIIGYDEETGEYYNIGMRLRRARRQLFTK